MNLKTGSYSCQGVSFLPSTAVLEMTYRCNHRCLFCSCPWTAENNDWQDSAELSTDQWKDVLEILSLHGIHNICFTGGEALLRSDIWDIIDYASRLRMPVIREELGLLVEKILPAKLYLLSNGKCVDDKVLDACKKYDIQLSVSMPGLRTFGELTGGGEVDRILSVFEGARKHGLKTVVGITVTKKNLGELYETIAAAFLAGATQLLLNRFLEGGRGRSFVRELELSHEEIIKMLDVAEQALIDARKYGSVGTELPACLFNSKKYQRLEVSTGCSAGKGFFAIGPSGKIRVCNHSEVELAHYSKIESLKIDPYWMQFAQSEYLPAMCFDCRDAGKCAGGCREAAHIVSGTIDASDALLV